MMTLGDPAGKSRTLHGSVSHTALGFSLILEYDVEELNQVAETALELSSELAIAQRVGSCRPTTSSRRKKRIGRNPSSD